MQLRRPGARSATRLARCMWCACLGVCVGLLVVLGNGSWSSPRSMLAAMLFQSSPLDRALERDILDALLREKTPQLESLCPRPPYALLPRNGSIVQLASYPGSGNTWTRNLFQRGTGYLTGSIYDDTTLVEDFAEGTRDSTVFVVKTHAPYRFTKDLPNYNATVYVLRNPFGAILSEFNFIKSNNHTGMAREDTLRKDEFEMFSISRLAEWLKHARHYLKTRVPCRKRDMPLARAVREAAKRAAVGGGDMDAVVDSSSVLAATSSDNDVQSLTDLLACEHEYRDGNNRPVLLVYYEDLKRHTQVELARMLAFVKRHRARELTWFDPVLATACAIHSESTQFKRPPKASAKVSPYDRPVRTPRFRTSSQGTLRSYMCQRIRMSSSDLSFWRRNDWEWGCL